MVWYDPRTWFKKEPKQEVTVTPIPAQKWESDKPIVGDTPAGYKEKAPPAGKVTYSGGGGGRTVTTPSGEVYQEQQNEEFVKVETKPEVQTSTPSINKLSPAEATPTSIGPATGPNLNRPYDVYEDMTFKEKTQSVGKKYGSSDFWRGIGQEATGTGNYQSPNPIGAFGSVFSPLGVFFRQKKGDIKTIDLPYSGTGIYNPQTGDYELPYQYKGKTGYERLQEQAIVNPDITKNPYQLSAETSKQVETELKPKYQARVDSGENINKVSEEYQQEAQKLYEERVTPKIQASQQFSSNFTKASELSVNIPSIASTAGVIGGFAVAPVLTGGAVFVSGQSMGYEGISEKNYLKAGLGFGSSFLGAYGAIRGVSNQITAQQIKDVASATPKPLVGYRTQNGQFTMDTYISTSQTSNAYAYTRGVTITKQIEGGRFISAGKSQTIISTTDFYTGKNIYVGSSQNILGAGYSFPASNGWSPSFGRIKTQTTLQYSARQTGNILDVKAVVPSNSITSNFYGGISKDFGKGVGSISGKITSAKVDTVEGYGTQFLEGFSYNYNIDTVGALIKKPSISTGGFIGGGSSNVVTGTKFSGITPTITDSLTKTASIPTSSFNLASTPSAPILSNRPSAPLVQPEVRENVRVTPLSTSQLNTAVIAEPATKTSLSTTGVLTSFSPVVEQIPRAGQVITPIVKVGQQTTQITKLVKVAPPAFTPSVSPDFYFPDKFPLALPPILLGGDFGNRPKRVIPVRKVTAYTPSFGALVFGIKGSRPKGIETGLRVRPIIKGFSWRKLFRK